MTDWKKEIDNEFLEYRKSGLAFSATIIVLVGIVIREILPKIKSMPISCGVILWSALMFGSIIVATLVQFCHFIGYRTMANRYFPPPEYTDERKIVEWIKNQTKKGNRWFIAQDVFVWLSGIFGLVGFFISIYYWRAT